MSWDAEELAKILEEGLTKILEEELSEIEQNRDEGRDRPDCWEPDCPSDCPFPSPFLTEAEQAEAKQKTYARVSWEMFDRSVKLLGSRFLADKENVMSPIMATTLSLMIDKDPFVLLLMTSNKAFDGLRFCVEMSFRAGIEYWLSLSDEEQAKMLDRSQREDTDVELP